MPTHKRVPDVIDDLSGRFRGEVVVPCGVTTRGSGAERAVLRTVVAEPLLPLDDRTPGRTERSHCRSRRRP